MSYNVRIHQSFYVIVYIHAHAMHVVYKKKHAIVYMGHIHCMDISKVIGRGPPSVCVCVCIGNNWERSYIHSFIFSLFLCVCICVCVHAHVCVWCQRGSILWSFHSRWTAAYREKGICGDQKQSFYCPSRCNLLAILWTNQKKKQQAEDKLLML